MQDRAAFVSCKLLVYLHANKLFAIDVYRSQCSIRNSARSHSTPMGSNRVPIQPQSSHGGIFIVILFLLGLLDIDRLALVECHAVGIVAAAVGVTVASVAVATASHIVALAFAVVAAGKLFAAALNEFRACDTVSSCAA